MTLSKLIGSMLRREPATAGTAQARRAVSTGSSPDVAAALLKSEWLEFIPGTSSQHSLGATREVRERVAEILPGVTFDESGRGAFTRNGYVVNFDAGHEDQVTALRVHVEGGAAAMPPLARIVSKTGWRLVPQKRSQAPE